MALRPRTIHEHGEDDEGRPAWQRATLSGEQVAVNPAQAQGGADRPVEGITERTGQVNPDNAPEARKSGDPRGMAGPVGYFEGEGNEGPLAPLAGDVTKSAEDGKTNSQGGVASGAPGLTRPSDPPPSAAEARRLECWTR